MALNIKDKNNKTHKVATMKEISERLPELHINNKSISGSLNVSPYYLSIQYDDITFIVVKNSAGYGGSYPNQGNICMRATTSGVSIPAHYSGVSYYSSSSNEATNKVVTLTSSTYAVMYDRCGRDIGTNSFFYVVNKSTYDMYYVVCSVGNNGTNNYADYATLAINKLTFNT
jgi:hypothetical protein